MKNICNVDVINNDSDSTQFIVDDGGKVRRLPFDKIFEGKSYDKSLFYFQTFYTVNDFCCYKIGKLVFINFGYYLNDSNVTLMANSLYGINYSSIPNELKPKYVAFLNGFACDNNWGNAIPLSVYLNNSTGIFEYTTPAVRTHYKISGVWIVD